MDKKKGDWLWCLHCERVFKWDGKKEECSYSDCDGSSWDIHVWEKEGIPRFIHPDYPEEPELGIKYSLYTKGNEKRGRKRMCVPPGKCIGN